VNRGGGSFITAKDGDHGGTEVTCLPSDAVLPAMAMSALNVPRSTRAADRFHLNDNVLVAMQVVAGSRVVDRLAVAVMALRRDEGGDQFALVERQRVRCQRPRCLIAVSFKPTKRNDA
jgi:hypothetical protein